MMSSGDWLQTSFTWDPAALDAQPAKPAADKPAAKAAPVCQVEGCGVDLTDLRYFFRKQRICEHHARADVVTDSAGRLLRFCQQCTRLEPTANFGAGRRSCKASLAKRQARAHRSKGHSSPGSSPERDVKPSHRPVAASTTAGEGASSGKGSSSRSGTLPSSKRSRASRPDTPGGLAIVSNGSSDLRTVPLPLPPQQPAVPLQQPAAPPPPQPELQHSGPESMLWSHPLSAGTIDDLLALDPDALADALQVPQALPGGTAWRYSADDGSDWARYPRQQAQAASSPGSGSPGAVLAAATPFSQPLLWGQLAGPIAAQVGTPADGAAAVGGLAAAADAPVVAWQGTAAAAGGPAWGGNPAFAQAPPSQQTDTGSEGWGAQPEAQQAAAIQQQASGVAAAVAQAFPLHVVTRFSLKIFGVNPDGLPHDLRAELLAALEVSPTVLEGAIRCGCTHMVVDVLLSAEEQLQLSTPPRLAAVVQHLRRQDTWHSLAGSPAVVAQLGQLAALTPTASSGAEGPGLSEDGTLPCFHVCSWELLPQLELVGPLATTAGAARGSFLLAASSAQPHGARQAHSLAAALKSRCHGRHVGLAVSVRRPSGSVPAAAGDGEQQTGVDGEGNGEGDCEQQGSQPCAAADRPGVTMLEAWAPEATRPSGWGLYEFELCSGSLLSDSVPVLVLPDHLADAAAELCQLQTQAQQQLPGASAAGVVRLVAAVLRFLHLRQQAALAAGHGSAADAAFGASYPPAAIAKLAAVARSLTSLAVRARWPAVVRLLLPAVTADGTSPAVAAQQMNTLSSPAPSMVHLAVASGCADTLGALRAWADSQRCSTLWREAAAGGAAKAEDAGSPRRGPSLLLLAAAMGRSLDAQMAQQLLELLGQERLALAADAPGPSGWSPRRVASATDNAALLAVLPAEPQQVQPTAVDPVAAEQDAAAAAAAAASCRWQGMAGGKERVNCALTRQREAVQPGCPASYEPAECTSGHMPSNPPLRRAGSAPQRELNRASLDAALLARLSVREADELMETVKAHHVAAAVQGAMFGGGIIGMPRCSFL